MASDLLGSDWRHIPALFLAGVVGESYGAVLGGGSLVVQNALLLVGSPLRSAIAIDIGASLGTEFGIVATTWDKVARHKQLIAFMSVAVFLGGLLGTTLLMNVSRTVIRVLMIIVVAGLLVRLVLRRPQAPTGPGRLGSVGVGVLALVLVALGIYANFLSIAEGTFGRLAVMALLGADFVESHGLKTIATIPARVYSLVITGANGLIVWPYLVTLGIAGFIAGTMSTRVVKRMSPGTAKVMMVVVAGMFLLYLLLFV